MFKKILIANRGEIAVRVIRACHECGIEAVAVFSEVDRLSRHVLLADQAWLLEGEPGKVYLDMKQIIGTALKCGAEAIHPGYGFLSENAEFAEAVAQAGLVFIGPRPEVIRKMGSKVESRRIMESAGVPVVPGTVDPVCDLALVKELCAKFGYPVAIKASAGGGGRGLRVVRKEAELEQALTGAQREGSSYFGNAEVYLEKYLDRPRHIEVQILADEHGNVVHLGERDCSSQRRHQKLLEETPAVGLSPALKERIFQAAVKAAKSIGYTSAGTVEGLVAGEDYYFLEMNTRVQVEHPITEMVTGIDIVKEQIRIAAGERLSFTQADVSPRGHAIECRINAEDPFKNFMPSPGVVHTYAEPSLPWVRVDSACYPGYKILPFYDSLLAKLVVWGRTREEAVTRTKIALRQFRIEGVSTTVPFHLQLLQDEAFLRGDIYTTFVEKELKAKLKPVDKSDQTEREVEPDRQRTQTRTFEMEVNRKHFTVSVAEVVTGSANGPDLAAPARSAVSTAAPRGGNKSPRAGQARRLPLSGSGEVCSSMHGLVKHVHVREGQRVGVGDKLLIIEAMKMESEVPAPRDGVVLGVKVAPGQSVEAGQLLIVLGDA